MYVTRVLREAAAVSADDAGADEFAALLLEALEDPGVRAAVQDAVRREPQARTRPRSGGGRRG